MTCSSKSYFMYFHVTTRPLFILFLLDWVLLISTLLRQTPFHWTKPHVPPWMNNRTAVTQQLMAKTHTSSKLNRPHVYQSCLILLVTALHKSDCLSTQTLDPSLFSPGFQGAEELCATSFSFCPSKPPSFKIFRNACSCRNWPWSAKALRISKQETDTSCSLFCRASLRPILVAASAICANSSE